MSEVSTGGPETAPQWREEFFWFGSANYPSDATYRTNGEIIQLRITCELPLGRLENGQFSASADKVADFLGTYTECSFVVADSYEVPEQHGGGRTDPVLWMTGWKPLLTDEERADYFIDKQIGSKPQR